MAAERPPARESAPRAATAARRRHGARAAAPAAAPRSTELVVDLDRRRDQLVARVAELQWDLGGLAYEMAIRNHVKVEVLVKRAAPLQDADAELNEVERLVRMEETGDRRLLLLLRRPAQQRRHLLLAVRAAAAPAGLQRRDPAPLSARSGRASLLAEAAGDVVARPRVGRVGEDHLGVGELDQGADRFGRRSSRG